MGARLEVFTLLPFLVDLFDFLDKSFDADGLPIPPA
jgi:hypothetical protein